MKTNIRNFTRGAGERKIDIQIDPWDTYSLDNTAALIIFPMLLQLRQTKHGVPNDFIKSVGSDLDTNYCFDFIEDDANEVFNKECQNWTDTLDKMIWSFQQLVMDNYDSNYHHGNMKIGWKKVTRLNPATGKIEEMQQMIDENPEEHWYDYVGHLLHEERIQEGLNLFGKYFRSLWD